MKITLSLSAISWKSKPTDTKTMTEEQKTRNADRIKKSLEPVYTDDIEDLAEALEQGQTLLPPQYSTYPPEAIHWESQQVWVVDFDSKPGHVCSYSDALKHAARLGIPPALAYHTFSNSAELPRFRFVYYLSEAVKSKRMQRIISDALMECFKDFPIDAAPTTSLRQLVYGTTRGSVSRLHMKPTDADAFAAACVLHMTDAKDTHDRRAVERAARRLGLRVTDSGGIAAHNIPDDAHVSGGYDIKAYTPAALPDENSEECTMFVRNESSVSVFELAKTREPAVNEAGERSAAVRTERSTKANRPIETLDHVDWHAVHAADALYRDHMAGAEIPHDLRFTLAVNMAHLKGGEQRFRAGLAARWEHEQDSDPSWLERWNDTARAVFTRKSWSFRNYDNQTIKHQMEKLYPTILQDLKANSLYLFCLRDRRNRIVTSRRPQLATVSEVHAMVKAATERILASEQRGVFVIRADTGCGKSTIIREIKRPALVSIPRHDLIAEYLKRYADQGRHDIKSTPKQPDLQAMSAVINSYYHVGAGRAARQALYNLQRLTEVREFLEKESAALAYTGTILTTHARLPHVSTSHDLILIDEDPLPVLTPAGSVDLSSLETLLGLMRNTEVAAKSKRKKKRQALEIDEKLPTLGEIQRDIELLQGLVELVQAAPQSLPMPMPSIAFANAAYIQQLVVDHRASIRGNLLHLFDALGFVKATNKAGEIVISYVLRKELQKDKTIIIYSATLDKVTASSFFGSQLVEYIDTPPIELRGEMIQHVINTSRASLKDADIIDAATLLSEGLKVFTFKDTQEVFKNVAGYYGAVAGLNKWEGDDICLIGTPHMAPDYYVLRAMALGYKLKSTDLTFGEQEIEIDGMSTRFPTYAHPILQHIQLHLIRTEMLQTIGRARAVWHDVKIVIVANLPMMQAIFKHYTAAEVRALADEQRRRQRHTLEAEALLELDVLGFE